MTSVQVPGQPGADAAQVQPASLGLPGLSSLEAAIMELAWAAGGAFGLDEICGHLDRHRPTARSTAEAVVSALVRKGHLERCSRDGTWQYQPARTLAGYLGQVIGGLLARSPDRAGTLAQAGITEAPAGLTGPGVRVAVFYDGYWYQNAARFFAHDRGTVLSVAGLHDAIRWHAAGLFGCPVQQVTISHAHYVAGSTEASAGCEQEMTDHGVICHQVPVTARKGEVGADVELALTCYQLACETSADLVVLLAGDGDFAPLATRVAGRGLRVLVPVADFSYPRPGDGATETVTTSQWLTSRATDITPLAEMLAAADGDDYPPFLARPFPAAATLPDRQPGRRHGIITQWPTGGKYGFITDDDGLTWYAPVTQTPRHAPLRPGCPVTFTGDPETPPGRNCPPARAIMPEARRQDPVAVAAAGYGGLSAPGSPIPDLSEA